MAAIGIELPLLKITPVGFGFGSSQDIHGSRRHHCVLRELGVANFGRTRCFPVDFRCGWTFGAELPAEPTYQFDAVVPVNTMIEPQPEGDEKVFYIQDLEMGVPNDAYDQLRAQTAKFWFYVNFAYLDFMRNRHEVGFCWRWIESFGSGRFVADDTPEYNRQT